MHSVVLETNFASSWLESTSRNLSFSSFLDSISLNSSELNSSFKEEIDSTYLSMMLSIGPEFSPTMSVSFDPLINIISEVAF